MENSERSMTASRKIQIFQIQLLADLNLKKTPQLVEVFDDSKDIDEVLSLSPEKLLLQWMNYHLKRAGYKKTVSNFSSDVKDGEAYAYLIKALAPEHSSEAALETKDPAERAKMVLEQAEKLDCKRYLSPKDITEGSANLNLAFVAQIFQHRNGLTTDTKQIKLTQTASRDDVVLSREERAFRMWINILGIVTYVNNVFEHVRNGWVLLEVLDKVSPGSVNWKLATKPPIKMPFRKLENCNQVIQTGELAGLVRQIRSGAGSRRAATALPSRVPASPACSGARRILSTPSFLKISRFLDFPTRVTWNWLPRLLVSDTV